MEMRFKVTNTLPHITNRKKHHNNLSIFVYSLYNVFNSPPLLLHEFRKLEKSHLQFSIEYNKRYLERRNIGMDYKKCSKSIFLFPYVLQINDGLCLAGSYRYYI